MKILHIAALGLTVFISMADAAAIGQETAMSGCMRKVPMEADGNSEENTGPYDEEYGDGTDVQGDPYGDGDGAPEAEDQDQE